MCCGTLSGLGMKFNTNYHPVLMIAVSVPVPARSCMTSCRVQVQPELYLCLFVAARHKAD
jgi:hypothetical protein